MVLEEVQVWLGLVAQPVGSILFVDGTQELDGEGY
jgi:hypothetical protein